ncbi:MAG: DUF6088 family protein [Gemmatimonadales bacterium]
MPRPTSPKSVEQQILARLRKLDSSKGLRLLSASDFAKLGSRSAVDIALHRLARQGTIRRLTSGLYYVPIIDLILGELRPGAHAVVGALEIKHRIRTQPSGATAANSLGLSEQVPMRVVYLTDGPSRRLKIGKQEIVLKRTTPKNMETAGRLSGLVIQALRHLGQANVDDRVVAHLRRLIGPTERKRLIKDAPLAPAWIGARMREVAEGSK